MIRKEIRDYVQCNVDDALTRLFYASKENDFKETNRASVYLCTYKNKLVVLISKENFRSNFETCVELHCPGLTSKSKDEHLESILKTLPRCYKERIRHVIQEYDFKDEKQKRDWLYQFVTHKFALKAQDYFDNFLTDYLNNVRECKEYQQIVDIIVRKLQLCNDYAGEFETCTLIGDVIRSMGLNLTFDEINEITEQIYCSNVLENVRFKK